MNKSFIIAVTCLGITLFSLYFVFTLTEVHYLPCDAATIALGNCN